jgi:hypothetical protein
LEKELHEIDRSLRVQTLRLEEQGDPHHPIVALATERIEELSTPKGAVTDAIEALKTTRPAGHHPDEIVAMLDAVPDLRETLKTATPEQLMTIFRAFDVSITYDKPNQFLDLSAAIMPKLLPAPITDNDRPEEWSTSRIDDIAGGRFAPISDLAVPIEQVVPDWPGR